MNKVTQVLMGAALLLTIAQPVSAQKRKFTQVIDSLLTAKYKRSNIDTNYVVRPQTKWTVTARVNMYGSRIKSEGITKGIPQGLPFEMQLDAKTTLFNDGEAYAVIGPRSEKYVLVEKDYSQEILGTWEGHITSDQSAFDDSKMHRWEYKDDGTYLYLGLDEDGEWQADVNSKGDYFVDGNLLCTRWKNVGDPAEHREWWEITSMEDGVMNWTALRRSEQDSVYTATFSMRRVQEP